VNPLGDCHLRTQQTSRRHTRHTKKLSISSTSGTPTTRCRAPPINLLACLDAPLASALSQKTPLPRKSWNTRPGAVSPPAMFPPILNNAERKNKRVRWINFSCNCALFASIVATAQRGLSSCTAVQLRRNIVHQARQQGAVPLMEGPNIWGKQYLWPFQARGACCRPQASEARKVSGFGFYLPGVYTPRLVGFQILVLQFPHFLHAPTQNSKDLEKNTNSYDPKAGKTIGGPKELSPCISSVCPFKILETLICTRVKPIVDPLLPQQQAGFRHGVRPQIRSRFWHRTSRIAFQLRRPELCYSISQQPVILYGILTPPANCCDGYLTNTWSAWSMEVVGNRSFTLTTVNGKRSGLRRLKNGIPQGSVMALILFNIYISDLPTTISRQYAYADDLVITYADGRLAGCGRGAEQRHGNRRWMSLDLEAKSQHYKNCVSPQQQRS